MPDLLLFFISQYLMQQEKSSGTAIIYNWEIAWFIKSFLPCQSQPELIILNSSQNPWSLHPNMTDVSGLNPSSKVSRYIGSKRQCVSHISTLWYWNFSCVILFYPIVPYPQAFLHSFLLLVAVVKGIGPKGHIYFYSLVLEFFLCYSISIRQYPTRQHFYIASYH